jgi:putative peptidoglycan lipid II flippase
MSFVRSTATIGGFTLISRVLGFLRDMTIASSVGASYLSDAFFVAFKLPNFLRRLFAEGAFNAAFVPMFAGQLSTEGKESARSFAGEAMSFLLLVLLIVTGIFILAMPWIMYVLAPGFSENPTKFELTVTLTQITMPYIIFISLVSLLGGVLNSSHKFAAVAATPIILNLCLIIVPYCIDSITPTGAHALAIAVMVAGVAQWAWLVWFCKREGVLPRLMRPRLTPQVKKLLVLIAPVALGAGVAQINLFIDIIIATQFENGVSYLYYADRINELPLAVIGIAVGTALLPLLSRQIREGNLEQAQASQQRAIALASFLSFPAAVALVLLAQPIIAVMFERGEFSAIDTAYTYPALMAFALGLPAFILVKILGPIFYAHQDTKTPFKIGLVCIAVNLVCNLSFMWTLQHVGMALATTVAGWVNVWLMVRVARARGWLELPQALGVELVKTFASCALMVLGLTAFMPYATPYFHGDMWHRFAALAVVVAVGIAAYALAAVLFNTLSIRTELRSRLRRS